MSRLPYQLFRMMNFGSPSAIIVRSLPAMRDMDYIPDTRKRIVLVPPPAFIKVSGRMIGSMTKATLLEQKETKNHIQTNKQYESIYDIHGRAGLLEFDACRQVLYTIVDGFLMIILSVWLFRHRMDTVLYVLPLNIWLYMLASIIGTVLIHIALDNISKCQKEGLLKDRFNFKNESLNGVRSYRKTNIALTSPCSITTREGSARTRSMWSIHYVAHGVSVRQVLARPFPLSNHSSNSTVPRGLW